MSSNTLTPENPVERIVGDHDDEFAASRPR